MPIKQTFYYKSFIYKILIFVCIEKFRVCVCMCVCSVRVYLRVCVFVCVCICVYVCLYVCLCVCVCVYVCNAVHVCLLVCASGFARFDCLLTAPLAPSTGLIR